MLFLFIQLLIFLARKQAKFEVGVNRYITLKIMSINVSVICFKSKVLSNGNYCASQRTKSITYVTFNIESPIQTGYTTYEQSNYKEIIS